MDKEYYKIIKDGFDIYIMYDPKEDFAVQITNKAIQITKGKLIGWQISNREEFISICLPLLYQIQNFVKI
jgi:hypothetical protein